MNLDPCTCGNSTLEIVQDEEIGFFVLCPVCDVATPPRTEANCSIRLVGTKEEAIAEWNLYMKMRRRYRNGK